MGLGNDDDAGDPERVELVEDDVDDGGLCSLGGLHQGSLHVLEVVDGVRVAIEQLEQQVPSQGVQSTDPPLSDPSIYRTSPATNLFVAVHRTFASEKFFAASNTDVTVWSVFGHCKKKVLLGAGIAGASFDENAPYARLLTSSTASSRPRISSRDRRSRP